MRRRPVCILCLLLVAFLCVTDWLGFSLIRGNPLPESVQTWISKHPESTICGEVVRCQENEDTQSVYLRNTYLIIYNSEKSSEKSSEKKSEKKSEEDSEKDFLKNSKRNSYKNSGKNVEKELNARVCLKNYSLNRTKSPTNCDAHLAESLFQTRSGSKYEKIPIHDVKVYLDQKKTHKTGKKYRNGNPNQNKNKQENEESRLLAGSLVLISGKLEEVQGPSNPGEFDNKAYLACQHIYYVMKKGMIKKRSQNHSMYGQFLIDMRQRFTEILEKAGGEEAGALEAIVLGDKSNLDAELKMRYQMAGIIHILAISGLHISLLGMGLYELLKRAGIGIWPAGLLALSIMIPYGMMTGGNVSTMRAVCMFLLSVGAKIAGRIYDMPTGMAAAAILILTENPAYLLDGGFLLSFGSVIGIGCVWPVFAETLQTEKKLLRSFLASGVVQLTTLPVVLWFYGEVSVVGIFLNLLVLPTVGIVLGSGTAGALLGLFYVKASLLAVFPGRLILKGYEQLVSIAGKLPFCTWTGGRPQFWQIMGYYLILTAAMWIYKTAVWQWTQNGEKEKCIERKKHIERKKYIKRRKYIEQKKHIKRNPDKFRRTFLRRPQKMYSWIFRLLSAGAIWMAILLLGYKPAEEFRIACLDVGQGDGIVIELENNWNLLIDGGSTNKNATGKYQILPYLKSRGISHLDGIYISHTDEDHISGVRELMEYTGKGLTTLRIDNLFLPDWTDAGANKNYQELIKLAKAANIQVFYIKEGDEIRYGNTSLKVLWPEQGASGENVNEDAMVLEMKNGDFRGIFTGDIGMETEKKLLRNGALEDIDFLKTAHHGSRYSTGEEFLEITKPELSVISCSATNTYGHPSPDTLKRLENSGSKVLITRDVGAVTIYRKKGRTFVQSYY